MLNNLFGKKKVEGAIDTYTVGYLGGHPDYLKDPNKLKKTWIKFNLYDDKFEFENKDWFKGVIIPANKIKDVAIVERQIGGLDALGVGMLASNSLKQPNNINISYVDENNQDVVIRFEMFSGGSVWGTAKKCQEFMDLLVSKQIRSQFMKEGNSSGGNAQTESITEKLEKLASLKEKGIITEEEFQEKKKALLEMF